MADEPGPSAPLLRWCGLALVPAGVSMAVATLLHPSRETAGNIIATEVGLVAAHFLYTLGPRRRRPRSTQSGVLAWSSMGWRQSCS